MIRHLALLGPPGQDQDWTAAPQSGGAAAVGGLAAGIVEPEHAHHLQRCCLSAASPLLIRHGL